MFHLFDVKTGKELVNLPKIKSFYDTPKLKKGVDLIKIFYNKKELRMKAISYSDCTRKNCYIVSHSLRGWMKPMFEGQIDYYKLVHNEELKKLPTSYTIQDVCPDRVKIKFDITYNRMRIEGRGVNWRRGNYKGKWVYIDDFEGEEEDEV